MESAFSLEQLDRVVEEILARPEHVFTFTGDLGAGKTTLIKAICRRLGVEHEISSPSFGIVNQYDTSQGPAYHFDLYRTRDVSELLEIGFDEYLESGAYCFIEWPEIAEHVLEHYDCANVELQTIDDHTRSVHISS